MRVLVFGETGQVARSLVDVAARHEDLAVRTLSRREADLTDPDSTLSTTEAGAYGLLILRPGEV